MTTHYTSLTLDLGWAFLEQLALAAIDVGRVDIADVCLHFSYLHNSL
jgi:hypothetical protein